MPFSLFVAALIAHAERTQDRDPPPTPPRRPVRAADPARYRDHQGVKEKQCAHCQQWRPLAAFGPDAHHPDGRKYECRRCHNQARRARRLTGPVDDAIPIPKRSRGHVA